GTARVVVCYRALNERSGRRFGRVAAGAVAAPTTSGGDSGWHYPMGLATPAPTVALVAPRHMHRFRATRADLGPVTVAPPQPAPLGLPGPGPPGRAPGGGRGPPPPPPCRPAAGGGRGRWGWSPPAGSGPVPCRPGPP